MRLSSCARTWAPDELRGRAIWRASKRPWDLHEGFSAERGRCCPQTVGWRSRPCLPARYVRKGRLRSPLTAPSPAVNQRLLSIRHSLRGGPGTSGQGGLHDHNQTRDDGPGAGELDVYRRRRGRRSEPFLRRLVADAGPQGVRRGRSQRALPPAAGGQPGAGFQQVGRSPASMCRMATRGRADCSGRRSRTRSTAAGGSSSHSSTATTTCGRWSRSAAADPCVSGRPWARARGRPPTLRDDRHSRRQGSYGVEGGDGALCRLRGPDLRCGRLRQDAAARGAAELAWPARRGGCWWATRQAEDRCGRPGHSGRSAGRRPPRRLAIARPRLR